MFDFCGKYMPAGHVRGAALADGQLYFMPEGMTFAPHDQSGNFWIPYGHIQLARIGQYMNQMSVLTRDGFEHLFMLCDRELVIEFLNGKACQFAPQGQQQTAQQPAGAAGGFVDIDWRMYAPLEAGISYDPNRDYKFHRAEGFVGSVPQNFVNRTFVKCPLCCSPMPNWTISQHNQMKWKGNLYLFRCSQCGGIISMSMPDVTTLGNGGSGLAFNPSVGLTNLMVKRSAGKEPGAVYAVIENVGVSGVNPECQGKEFKLDQLQHMSQRM